MRATTALAAAALAGLAGLAVAAPYAEQLVDYNLNMNKDATDPTQYTTLKMSTYTPSPPNWRAIPFYTLLPDKFADGDPSNNDYFGTLYEADWRETQLRFGGDVKGMEARLDYLAGMGVRGIFMSGTLFLNQLWQADSECRVSGRECLLLTQPARLLPARLHRPRPPLRHDR
jgi:alpha-1,3-glucan synthase